MYIVDRKSCFFETFLAIFIKNLLTTRKRRDIIKMQRDREKERSAKVDRVT